MSIKKETAIFSPLARISRQELHDCRQFLVCQPVRQGLSVSKQCVMWALNGLALHGNEKLTGFPEIAEGRKVLSALRL